jgi:hypothetical protein
MPKFVSVKLLKIQIHFLWYIYNRCNNLLLNSSINLVHKCIDLCSLNMQFSASNSNQYQGISLGVKCGRRAELKTVWS